MTIAIIGAGFVGTRLASVLTDAKIPFAILDKVLKEDQYIDITDPETFRSLPHFDAVINLAAEHRDDVSPNLLYDLVNIEAKTCVNSVENEALTTSYILAQSRYMDLRQRGPKKTELLTILMTTDELNISLKTLIGSGSRRPSESQLSDHPAYSNIWRGKPWRYFTTFYIKLHLVDF